MEIAPDECSWKELYRLVTSTVVPRPIGWISTCDEDGTDNLAPYSSFNYVSHKPAILMFTAGLKGDDELKDTPRNAIDTGEFVYNLVTRPVAEQMNQTGDSLPSGQSEFDAANVERAESATVAPPRVAAADVSFECELYDTYQFDHGRVMVMGEVTHVHLNDSVLTDGQIDARNVDAVGRLGGPLYTGIDVMDLRR